MDATGSREVGHAVSDLRRLIRNGLSLAGAYVLPRLCTLAAAVVAARALGVAQFGAWGAAAALAVILSVAATLGMMQLLVREIARSPDRAPALIGAANIAKLASTAIMLAGIAIVAAGPLGWRSDVLAAALLLASAYGVGAFVENLGAWFQGTERMEVWMQAQLFYGVVAGGSGIALAVATHELVWFCLSPLAGQCAALAWLLHRAPREIRIPGVPPFDEVRRLLVSLAPFAAAFLLLTAYYKVDIILLGRWRGQAEAGVYAAGYRFVDVAQALAVVIASALYPRLSRLAGGPGRPATRTVELMLLAVVPASAVLWLIRGPLVMLLFGGAYAGAAEVLALLAPALPFLALNALGTFVLAAAGRTGLVAAAYAGALATNIALNALWIPDLGALGASRAMLVSEGILGIVMLVTVARIAGAAIRVPSAAPVAIAAVLPAAVALTGAPPVTAAWIYAGAIGIVYSMFRVVPAAERSLLRRALVG